MNILVKNVLRSISKSKFSTFLIILTIVLVTIIFFLSASSSDIIYSVLKSEYSRINIDADILVGSQGGGEMYSQSLIASGIENDENVQSITYFLRSSTVLSDRNNEAIFLEATDLETFFEKDKSFSLISSAQVKGYPEAVVSEEFLEKYQYNIGDTLTILSPINMEPLTFSITKVVTKEGFFSSMTLDTVLVDLSAVGSSTLVNNTLIKLKDGVDKDEYIEKISTILPYINVGSALPDDIIGEMEKESNTLYVVALLFVVVLMSIILFTMYLLLSRKRVDEIVVFKSVGATPFYSSLVIILEALIYGIVGGIVGLIFGRIILEILESVFLTAGTINYRFWKYLVSFLGSVLLSIVASLIPAISSGKKTIKDLLKDTVKHTIFPNKYLAIALLIVVATLLLATLLTEGTASLVLALVLVPFVVASLFVLTPYVLKVFTKIFSLFSKKGFSGLFSKNMNRHHASSVLTMLVALIIGFSFLFFELFGIVVSGITPYRSRIDADIVAVATKNESLDTMLAELNEKGQAVYYKETSLFIDTGTTMQEDVISYIVGSTDTLKLMTTGLKGQTIDDFATTENGIVLNYDLAKSLNIEVGDNITLGYTVKTSQNKTMFPLGDPFKVVGFDYTDNSYPKCLFIKIDDALGKINIPSTSVLLVHQLSYDDTNDIMTKYGGYAVSRDTFVYTGQNPDGLISVIYVLEGVFLAVAVLGLVNLIFVELFERDNEFFAFKSAGCSYHDYLKLSVPENMLVSLSGMTMGLVITTVFSALIPSLYTLVGKHPYYAVLSPTVFLVALIGGVGYLAIASLIRLSTKKRFLRISKNSF